MKHFLCFFLYLNICVSFIWGIHAQKLQLQIQTEPQISKSLLDSLNIQTFYSDYISLKKETDSLAEKLQLLGYIESELKPLIKNNDSTYTASFLLGERVNYIKVHYDPSYFRKNELLHIAEEVYEEYFILKFSTLKSSLNKLNSYRIDDGSPFARIRLDNIEKDGSDSLTATLVLDEGNKRIIDSIVIKGYDKFPRSFLTHYTGIRPGQPFSQKKLLSQNEILNNLGFANTLKAPEVLFREKATWVYFYLNKQNNNLFDGILGFSTNPENQNLEFNGYLNLELNNNLNYGEQLVINYKADGNEQQNFRVKINLPYLFKTPIGVGAELKIFKRDSSFVTTEQHLRLTYQINPSSSSYVGYKGALSSNLLEEVVNGNNIEDYTSRFATTGLNYIKQQSVPLFPVKTFIALDAEIGVRELKTKTENQQRISTLFSHIFNLNNKNSIYFQNHASMLISDSFIENELFRFGGINTMRGFDENSIDATLFAVLNTEYRYSFTSSMFLHSIIDLGYFENQVFQQKEKLYSFGLGLGMQTKAGFFRINLANGKSENQNFKFSSTKIHLSISSTF